MPLKPRLHREMVIYEAARLADAEGVDALTLNRLAARLGIRPPSLYNHVDGMPGLLRELALLNIRMLEARLKDAAVGRSGADAIRALAQAYREYIKEHPGVYLAGLRAQRLHPPIDAELRQGEERVVGVVLAVLAPFGLSGEDALHAVRGLRSLVHGFATLEIAGGFGLPLDCDESFRRLVNLLIAGLLKDEKGSVNHVDD